MTSGPAESDRYWEPGGRSGVTSVVLARNEERHLADCLRSLDWSDEIVVLDSGSEDGTVALARSLGARVEHRTFENFSVQRQHALSLVDTPWVLFVDADERVPPALADEVRAEIETGRAAGFWIPRQNRFWSRTMRGGGWWPDYQLRLLRVASASYDPRRAVHEVADVVGPTARLVQPLVHFNYDSLDEFRSKQAAYGRLDAERRHLAGERVRPHNLVLQPYREMVRRYVHLGGWRDGALGLLVCSLMAWQELATLRAMRRMERARRRAASVKLV